MNYNPHIFDTKIELLVRIEAANSNHARQKLAALFKDRLTQYAHPEDIQPSPRVIGVILEGQVWEPVRIELNERDTKRPTEHTEETSKEETLPPGA